MAAAPSLQIEAYVLRVAAHAGDFTRLELFSATEGFLHAMLREPSAKLGPAPDLFDRLALTLDRGRAGATGPCFVRELRLLTRHAEIGRDYAALSAASRLARLVARNPVPAESRAAVERLLEVAFAAFARPSARADVVYWKSLYVLAREEGHPLKQQWLATLPPADAALAAALLPARPEEAQATPEEVARLTRRLEAYLSEQADFIFA
jgi:hypothetical protein